MTRPLPKWEMKTYARLWQSLKQKDFTIEEVEKILKLKDTKVLSVLIYDLKRNGWLTAKKDKIDRRKRIYKLIKPNDAIIKMETKDE